MAASGTCFLTDWEARRTQAHTEGRRSAESLLCDIQLRLRSAISSLDSWLTVLDTRRQLEAVSADAATRAANGIEKLWQPQRLDAIDGDVATWLVAAEQAHVSAIAMRAKRWAEAAPSGGDALKHQHRELAGKVTMCGEVIVSIQAWDKAHEAADVAWREHNERLQAARSANEDDVAPPDSWLSEVRYREVARAHLRQQALAEEALCAAAQALAELEVARAAFWDEVATNYARTAADTNGLGLDSAGQPVALPIAPKINLPISNAGLLGAPAASLTLLKEMPTASGDILWRQKVAMIKEAGLFGFGGGGWQEGATLVLTLNGYLHLFFNTPSGRSRISTAPNNVADKDAAEGAEGEEKDDELVEANIRASVYVPLSTRCVFLRKGKVLTLDVSEADATGANAAAAVGTGNMGAASGFLGGNAEGTPTEATGANGQTGESTNSSATEALGKGGKLLRWIRGESSAKLIPRRVQARVGDGKVFDDLERRCHDLVRRGQNLRSKAATATSSPAAAR